MFSDIELDPAPGKRWRVKVGGAWVIVETHPLPSYGEVVTSAPFSHMTGRSISSFNEVVEDRERKAQQNECCDSPECAKQASHEVVD